MAENSNKLIQFPTQTSPIPEELKNDLITGKLKPSTGNFKLYTGLDKPNSNNVQYEYQKSDFEQHNKRSDTMSNDTDVLKLQIQHLEEKFDTKLQARDQLIDSKFELLNKSMENIQSNMLHEIKTMKIELSQEITNSIQQQKDIADEKQKETKKFIWTAIGVVATVATLVVTIAIPIVQTYIK